MLKSINIFLFFVLITSVIGQTNNCVSDYDTIKKIEDLYFLNIKRNHVFDVKLSGRIMFENNQFGTANRIISCPAIKVEF